MKLAVAVVVLLVPVQLLSQESTLPSVYYLDPGPATFTVAVDSYANAVLAINQLMPSDNGSLVRSPVVMGELELVDNQKEKLTAQLTRLEQEYLRRNTELAESFDGSQAATEKMQSVRQKYLADVKGTIEDVLLPFQLERLRQIRLQAAFRNGGSHALQSGEFAELINLSADQKAELSEKAAEAEENLMKEFQVKRQKMHRELLKDVLTKEQLKIFDESFGKPMKEVAEK